MSELRYGLAAIMVVQGLVSLISGRFLGAAPEAVFPKYEPKAYTKWSRIMGIYLLIGAAMTALLALMRDGIVTVSIPGPLAIVIFAALMVSMVLSYIFVLRRHKLPVEAENDCEEEPEFPELMAEEGRTECRIGEEGKEETKPSDEAGETEKADETGENETPFQGRAA